jgi:hypothetical protein
MSSSSPESSQELDFPPVRVNQSIERLDLNDLIMRSNAQPNVEEATSLDGSTYDLVGMSDNETTDDEGHTVSVVSTTPDDISVLSDDDDVDDFEQEDTYDASQPSNNSTAEAADIDEATGVEESMLTETSYLTQSESHPTLRLQEELGEGDDGKDAWVVAKVCTPAQTAEGVLKRYGCSEMRLTVRAALSDLHLPARSSFKILYVGKIEEWAKDQIDACISSALNASPGPSRSILRHGQMEPFGTVLTSERCADIKRVENGILVLFDDRTNLAFSNQRKYAPTPMESARFPDLVVFWYPQPKLAAPEVNDFPRACEAFEKQHISCLHIAEDRRFHLHSSDTVTNSQNLRTCVEGKKKESEEFQHQETIPVDLYTVLSLEPSQLNRHLAALDSRMSSTPASKATYRNLPNISKYTSWLDSIWSVSTLVLLWGVCLAAMTGYTFSIPGLQAISPQAQVHIPTSIPVSISTQIPLPVSSPTSIAHSSTSPILSAPVTKVTPREISVISSPKIPYWLEKKESKTAGFDIQTTSEHQFVLNPTKEFISKKGKPQLQIQVSRDTENIPVRYTRTLEGAYIVDLEKDYPLGPFNVSIATHSKPLMQQTFAISMGHNKTIIAQIFDLVKRDVTTTQQGLKKWSSTLTGRLQAGLARSGGSSEWTKQAQDSSRAVKDAAKHQVSTGATMLQGASENTWKGLRKATAPVRTSDAALRARDNAFQIRCRFEEAVGLSSTTKEGKKSRSCQHVGR